AGSAGSRAAGSKKYSDACVPTTLTRWPARFRSSYSCGVRMAATEPVTPRRTLAMGPLLVQAFRCVEQAVGQFAAGDAVVAALERAEVGQGGGAFQRVGRHEVRGGVAARALGDLQQPLVADADLELELDQDAPEAPRAPHQVHQLGRADQAQPQLR